MWFVVWQCLLMPCFLLSVLAILILLCSNSSLLPSHLFSHGLACVPQAASLIGIAKIGAVFPGLGDETLLLDGTSFWNARARILRMTLYCCHLWHSLLGSLADHKLFWGAGLEIIQFKPLKLHSSSPCVDLRSHRSVQGEKAVLGGTFFVQVGR